jgi:hypothetical protein
MEHVGAFYGLLAYFMKNWSIFGHLVYFMVICYIFPVLVCCSKKNLAILAAAAEDTGPIEKG